MYVPTGQEKLCPTDVVAAPGGAAYCKEQGIVPPDPRYGCCIEEHAQKFYADGAKPPAKGGYDMLVIGAVVLGAVWLIGGRR